MGRTVAVNSPIAPSFKDNDALFKVITETPVVVPGTPHVPVFPPLPPGDGVGIGVGVGVAVGLSGNDVGVGVGVTSPSASPSPETSSSIALGLSTWYFPLITRQ